MKKIFLAIAASFAISPTFGAKIAVSSYPWQKATVVEMLSDLREIGVRNVSMFQNIRLGGGGKYAGEIFRYNMPEVAKAEAKKIFDASGARVVSIGHISLSDEAEIKKVFEFAKYFGAEAMTVEAPESALPAYDRLAKEYGIKAGLYNHRAKPKGGKAEPPYSTPEKMNAALARRSGLGAFPDCGHWGRSGFDIIESLKKLEGKISAVNIQDLTESGGCEEYGKGVLPLDDFLKELEKLGFDGWCVVMFDAAPDRSQIEKVAPSVKYLEACGFQK